MSQKPVLVVMAAGMGSRYGGLKQMDPVGANGELILDYSLFDARRAGFERAVIVIKKENEEAFRQRLQAAVAKYDEALFLPAQLYDEAVSLSECTRELHQQLALLAPFGCENPSPLLLVEDAWPIEHRAVGNEGAHLKLSLRQNERILPGIAFSMGSEFRLSQLKGFGAKAIYIGICHT